MDHPREQDTRSSAGSQPLLYAGREYVEHADGGTTTCVSTTTSPVKEYSPDD